VADESPERLLSDYDLLRENRLVLPVVPKLALALGLPANLKAPEELAEAILSKSGRTTR
jgi:hypothetical protein